MKLKTGLSAALVCAVVILMSCFAASGATKTVKFKAPAKVSVTPGVRGIIVKWSRVSGVKGQYRYRLYTKTASGYKTVATTAKNTFTDTSLNSGDAKKYAVRIVSVKTGKAHSPLSKLSALQRWVSTPKLSYARYNPSAGGTEIRWNRVPNAGAYRLFYKTVNSAGKTVWNTMKTLDKKTTSYTDPDTGLDLKWSYTIRCMNSAQTKYTSGFDSNGLAAAGAKSATRRIDSTAKYEYILLSDSTARIVRYLSAAKSLVVPATLDGHTVSEIGKRVFENDKNLTDLTLSPGLRKIGWWAFCGCKNLSAVTLPDGLSEISYGAFLNCPKLSSLKIPDSVTEIGREALAVSTSIEKYFEDRLNIRRLSLVHMSLDHSFEIITGGIATAAYKYAAQNELKAKITTEPLSTASQASALRSPLANKSIFSTGDSVAKGTGTNINTSKRYSYPYYLRDTYGMKLTTTAESSITLAKQAALLGTDKRSILERIEELCKSGKSYDAIILDGGFNDVFLRVPLGEVTPQSHRNNDFDVYTTAGALEKICYLLNRNYASTPKLFVLCHRIESSKLQLRYFSVIRRILDKWGISYVDLTEEAELTGDGSALTNNYLLNREGVNDRIHPTRYAHYTIYGPAVAKELEKQFAYAPSVISSAAAVSKVSTPRLNYAVIKTVRLSASNVETKVTADTRSLSVISVHNAPDYVEALVKINNTDISSTTLTTHIGSRLFTTTVKFGENGTAPKITAINKTAAGLELTTTDSTGCHYYNIYRRTSPTGKYTLLNENPLTGTVSFADDTVERGKTYYYSVRGVSGNGKAVTDYSDYAEPITVGHRLNINCIGFKSVTVAGGTATLDWKDESYLHKYTVLIMDVKNEKWHICQTLKNSTHCFINSPSVLKKGHTYRFAVRALAGITSVNGTKVYTYMSGSVPSGNFKIK